MQSKYKLAVTEYYLPERHGLLDADEEYIAGHIMLMESIDHVRNTGFAIHLKEWKNALYNWIDIDDDFDDHPVIRNIHGILNKDRYMEINILEQFDLSSGHTVCVLKTFWLRCFQRFWRKRGEMLKKRNGFGYLKKREMGLF